MEANAAVHSIYPMLESVIVEYADAVVLPDEPPGELYTFTDSEGGTATRTVTAVYTNDQARTRTDAQSVPGRFVIVQLEPVVNPRPDSPEPWMPNSLAGRALIRSGWTSTFRMDYTGLEVRQTFDAYGVDGRLLRRAGSLPNLRREDIRWPEFDGFTIDQVLPGRQGDIHYSYYLPPGYNPSRRYPMVLTVPGYGELLHSLGDQTRGINLFTDRSSLAWTQASEDVIVVALQPAGNASAAAQAIELTEHFLDAYSVDSDRVYAMGYSAGGEILSQALNTRADLFAAYIHASSRWNGSYDDVVKHRLPVYIFMAESDEYYGAQRARDAYDGLTARYADAGLGPEDIARLVVLDLPDDAYFARQGINYFHDGGKLAADNDAIIR
ncbi:MAG TPA: prolyl oligopeptidase family serine peptidase, partial [Roseiflexaceae bacterium]|nr:prolyl oligopeptidase family serine peptidase [Roseiflexaceae bacterium]